MNVKLMAECDRCGGEHEAELAHVDQFNGRQLYAVICHDGLTDYVNDLWPMREVKA